MLLFLRALILLLLLLVSVGSRAQSPPGNDGFQRRDGAMYLIRNGQKRPMAHDVHLPNGRTITHDGFVVAPDGRRTELAEGTGCTLLGEPTVVVTTASGQLAVAAPGRPQPTGAAAGGASYEVDLLDQFFGRRSKGHKGRGYYKKHGKGKHKKDDD